MNQYNRYATYRRIGNGYYTFRLLGFGIHIKDICINPMLFSEREGHQNFLLINHYLIKLLFP
jgi:hypothetical protein